MEYYAVVTLDVKKGPTEVTSGTDEYTTISNEYSRMLPDRQESEIRNAQTKDTNIIIGICGSLYEGI